MGKSLGRKQLPAALLARERVPVPEFNEAADDDPFEVWVRGLTVAEYNGLMRAAWQRPTGGEETVQLRGDYDEMCLVAGICTETEAGEMVFGDSTAEAEARVRGLPTQYRSAVQRIYRVAMELSGLRQAQPAAAAKKN